MQNPIERKTTTKKRNKRFTFVTLFAPTFSFCSNRNGGFSRIFRLFCVLNRIFIKLLSIILQIFIECFQYIRIDVKHRQFNVVVSASVFASCVTYTANAYTLNYIHIVKQINRIHFDQDLWALCAGIFIQIKNQKLKRIFFFIPGNHITQTMQSNAHNPIFPPSFQQLYNNIRA